MEAKNKLCPGTHRYTILKAFDFGTKCMFYAYCDKCGQKKRVTIRYPSRGEYTDITDKYANNSK